MVEIRWIEIWLCVLQFKVSGFVQLNVARKSMAIRGLISVAIAGIDWVINSNDKQTGATDYLGVASAAHLLENLIFCTYLLL